jgi:hypothetical protein
VTESFSVAHKNTLTWMGIVSSILWRAGALFAVSLALIVSGAVVLLMMCLLRLADLSENGSNLSDNRFQRVGAYPFMMIGQMTRVAEKRHQSGVNYPASEVGTSRNLLGTQASLIARWRTRDQRGCALRRVQEQRWERSLVLQHQRSRAPKAFGCAADQIPRIARAAVSGGSAVSGERRWFEPVLHGIAPPE